MLTGKTVLVTGANRGIGLALVKELLQHNASVLATARHPDKAVELAELASAHGAQLALFALDILDPHSIDLVTEEVGARVKCLDILINNAAIFPEEGNERFEELNLDHFNEAFNTNVVGTARVSRAFLPLLRKSTDPKLANISSSAASISGKKDNGYYCYATSKAALNMMTRALAAELRPEKIIVVPICPGWVKTDMGGPNAQITAQESAAKLVKSISALTMDQSGQFLSRFGTTNGTW